jgi:paraquat-inducible protein B
MGAETALRVDTAERVCFLDRGSMARKANPATIGAFVLGGVALAIVALALLGSGQLFEQKESFILFFDGSVNGLQNGSAVKFRGVPIGSVSRILLMLDRSADYVAIPVVIEIDEERVSTQVGQKVDLADPKILGRMIEDGLRARLEVQSLLTGLVYVELDFRPGTPVHLFPNESRYHQIPTLPSTLQEFNRTVSHVLDELSDVEFGPLITSITRTVEGIDRTVNSPKIDEALANVNETLESLRRLTDDVSKNVGPVAEDVRAVTGTVAAALKRVEKTLLSLQSLVQPESPFNYDLQHSLERLGAAADAIRNLADYLDRNPSALLRGRAAEAE